MLYRLYEWTMRMAGRREAPYALGGVSFAESSFFPIPPDVMLIPMCIARPKRAFFYALITTIGSVLGGVAGYLIGLFLYESIGLFIIDTYGLQDKVDAFRALFDEHGHWAILVAGFTPIPYKLVTILSGVAAYDILLFIALSLLTRGGRFFLLASLLFFFGERIRVIIERHFALLTWLFAILLIGGFFSIRFFF